MVRFAISPSIDSCVKTIHQIRFLTKRQTFPAHSKLIHVTYLSENSQYDHEFVCLTNRLDPSLTSRDKANALNGSRFASAAEMIRSNTYRLPPILSKHAELLATEFSWQGYQERNHDLRHLNPSQLVDHFLSHGLTEPRHWNPKASLLDRRFAWAAKSSNDAHLVSTFQAVVHVYHYTVLCHLAHYLKILARLGAKIHLLIANEAIADSVLDSFIRSLNSGVTNHSWWRVPNHGEDWSSFHVAFNRGIFKPGGITFKLQTKLSSNLGVDGGTAWIDEALGPLCGNQSVVSTVLEALSSRSYLVSASASLSRSGFGANPYLVKRFIDKSCVKSWKEYEADAFASGSMFAAGNDLIQKFYAAIGNIDYSEEDDNGTTYCGRYIGHALERVFFYHANDCECANHGAQSVCWL